MEEGEGSDGCSWSLECGLCAEAPRNTHLLAGLLYESTTVLSSFNIRRKSQPPGRLNPEKHQGSSWASAHRKDRGV